MKYFIAILLLSLSSFSFAGDWYKHPGTNTWYTDAKNKNGVSIQVNRTSGMSMIIKTPVCEFKNQERELGHSVDVMTQMDNESRIPIRFDFYCVDVGKLGYIVQMKDYKMLMDMFRVSSVIRVGEVEFSAMGFNKALGEIRKTMK
ncbi:hypothetical protein VPFG_00317 [Vibrio phage nt-1]|uniref:Uncharacterized protein n=1 Tax=Vibrio phage nt-1 TaxID=115992 RepID=R9TIV0_9CAUD|nr:hypothetical protein VPFG_00317 [Vibrio phage nt-1]AGN30315.1 hypothetical protein VPFG_00317 [Vibrio phage nt-1]